MKKVLYPAALLLILMLALTGCDKGSSSDSKVIAKVGKSSITEDDFMKQINRVPEWARKQFTDEAGKQQFLEELIRRELIHQKALDMRLHKDTEYMEKVEEFEIMTLVSMILKKEIEEKSVVGDDEVKAFYDQNSDKFRVGTQIKASHILVNTEEEAKDLHDKITKGEDFAKLAKAHSKDPGSAQKGGDLGYFGQGKMVPEFERAAIILKPGEVSSPVRTRFGYHIIKLHDIKKGELASFEQTKEPLRKQLLTEKRKKMFDAFVENLKGESEVTINEEAMAAINLPWQKAEEKHPEVAPAAPAEEAK